MLPHLESSSPSSILSSMAFTFPSILAILLSSQLVFAGNYSTVFFPPDSSLSWRNANSSAGVQTYVYPNSRIMRVLLLSRATRRVYGSTLAFGLGFYRNQRMTSKWVLSVAILETSARGVVLTDRYPELVWMANRNRPVGENAVLHADPGRGLVLTDVDGVEAFSTNISGSSAKGVILKSYGDLVLINRNDSAIWRSSKFPAKTLLLGQQLTGKWKLTSSLSNTNVKASKFSLSVRSSSLTAFVRYKKPVAYLRLEPQEARPQSSTLHRVIFAGTNITFVYKKANRYTRLYMPTTQLSPVQLLTMDPDGGPKINVWSAETGWRTVLYRLGGYEQCQLPMACGKYGLCTYGGCSCPTAADGLDYFTLLDPSSPNRGCRFVGVPPTQMSPSTQRHRLVDFGNLSYFSYFDPTAAVAGLTELGACVKACEGNSSCSAAFFSYNHNASDGRCHLPWEVLTVRAVRIGGDLINSVAYIKVPVPANSSSRSKKIVMAFAIVGSIGPFMLIWFLVLYKIKRPKRGVDCYEQLLGGLTRFSYKELSSATGRFSMRLGGGGFGSVFKGERKDGTMIAVKRLNSVEQGMSEFLAEVKTLGSLHHYNLVKLIGFCADESNRLLVYEYLSYGSLDKWIFDDHRKTKLNWETRRRIILHVARGLAYLHEECSQRIAHLDMKPHNILLDENFNAKISDFGLSRFIDRDQSHVTTGMRGTFGYLAPEWQHSRITVKADIYSFGIVILEAVSGRLNLDYSQEDSEVHLLGILQRKAEENRLVDVVDKKIADWESHMEDIAQMIKIGAWCLNEEQSKRPCMSTVVKILEGTVGMEHTIEFKFANALILSYSPFTEDSLASSSSSESDG